MSQLDGVQHICNRVKGALCSFPNYCQKNGCLNKSDEKENNVAYLTHNRLSFTALRIANLRRIPLFRDRQGRVCHTEADGSDWSPAEWLQATVGELGELANLLKKVNRGDFTLEEALPEIRKEFADVIIYFDIMALQFGIDLGDAVREKFNEVSRRVQAPVFIGHEDNVFDFDPDE